MKDNYYYLEEDNCAVKVMPSMRNRWVSVFPLRPDGSVITETEQPAHFYDDQIPYDSFSQLKLAHPYIVDVTGGITEEKVSSPVLRICEFNWTETIPAAIDAAIDGTVIEVPTKAMKKLAESACERMCPDKNLSIRVFK